MVKFLVPQFGARVYEKNFFHETCRDIAEQKGHQHVVEYLDSDFPTLKAKVSTTFQCILLSELTEYMYVIICRLISLGDSVHLLSM